MIASKRPVPVIGDTVGDWTITGVPHRVGGTRTMVACRCACGVTKEVNLYNLQKGLSPRCGECRYKAQVKHRECGTRLYHILEGIKARCLNPRSGNFKRYGGRGITMCPEWDDYAVFHEWAIRAGYKDNLTIERKNVNKGYNPDNCTWIAKTEQAHNKGNSVRVSVGGGKLVSLKEGARQAGIPYGTARGRYDRGVRGEALFAVAAPRRKANRPKVSSYGRPVDQLEISTLRTIRRWPKVITAARALGINGCGISRCVKGHIRSSGGFSWRYSE